MVEVRRHKQPRGEVLPELDTEDGAGRRGRYNALYAVHNARVKAPAGPFEVPGESIVALPEEGRRGGR